MNLKSIIVTTSLLLAFATSAQLKPGAECGQNENLVLNSCESEFLNEYYKSENKNFDFTSAKVIFRTGNLAAGKSTKKQYFASPGNISRSLLILTEEEKLKYGNVDAIICTWAKYGTPDLPKERRKMLKNTFRDFGQPSADVE